MENDIKKLDSKTTRVSITDFTLIIDGNKFTWDTAVAKSVYKVLSDHFGMNVHFHLSEEKTIAEYLMDLTYDA